MLKSCLSSFFILALVQLIGQVNVDSLLQIAESNQADSTRFDAYLELSYHYTSRDTGLSIKYLNEMKILVARSEIRNGHLNIYNRLGNLSQMGGDYNKAINYYKTGIQFVKDSANIARLYGGIGSSFYYKDNLDSAEHYLYLGYDIKTRWDKDEPKSLAKSLQNLAMVSEMRNNYNRAIKYYQDALTISLEFKEDRDIATIYNNMGAAYANTAGWESAFPYFQKSFELSKKLEDLRTIGNSATNLGNYYSTIQEYDKAVDYYHEAIESISKLGFNYDLVTAYQGLSENYINMNQPEKAMPILMRGFVLADSIDFKKPLVRLGVNLSKLKMAKGDIFEAKRIIDRTLLAANENEYLESKILTYQQASKIYEALGDEKQALNYYKIYSITSDSLDAGRQNKTVQELQVKYKTTEKEALLITKDLELEKKTKERNFYFFGLCLIGLSAIFLINRKNLNERLIKQKIYNLEQKQKLIAVDNMIQGQEDERKRIAKDLHDGLGGLLTSARLQMQKIQNEINLLGDLQILKKAETLIDNASEEVRRIAHDMMPDALMNLGLESAILDLSQEINQTTNIKVQTYFSHDEFGLDDNVQLVLYRIIQELSHNAVKYSKAQNLLIQIMDTGANYEITIEDDGIGFNFSEERAKQGMGLQNLVARLNYLGASFQFDNKSGASYLIKIPKN